MKMYTLKFPDLSFTLQVLSMEQIVPLITYHAIWEQLTRWAQLYPLHSKL